MNEQSLLDTVSDKYHLSNAVELSRLAGGEKNRVYKISNMDLVVRVYQPTAPLDGIEFEHS
jgi:Ser/Thr protein kinase RdoA (MazF antagonist)